LQGWRSILLGFALASSPIPGRTAEPAGPAADDGWFDVSGFLDEKYGFLPVAIPITEPAVGYGVAGGLTFISKPLGGIQGDYDRPDITFVGGLGTENGTWGGAAADMRQWADDRVQTLGGFLRASVHLDFYGVGDDPSLHDDPLGYDLDPTGGFAQGKLRLGDSRAWVGLAYAYASTDVTFDAPEGTPGLPDHENTSDVGGLTPSLTWDTRDNIFTPTRGTYVEASAGFFSAALGGNDEFQRARLVAMRFIALRPRLHLGLRGEAAATFGDTPFYLRPFLYLRGAPMMRYQGEEVAQIEGELRWQFWARISLVAFAGTGAAWKDLEAFDASRSIVTGGAGARYELARRYGLHVGVDVGVGPDTTALYIQFGSAWVRP
jgi:hypothetical protein